MGRCVVIEAERRGRQAAAGTARPPGRDEATEAVRGERVDRPCTPATPTSALGHLPLHPRVTSAPAAALPAPSPNARGVGVWRRGRADHPSSPPQTTDRRALPRLSSGGDSDERVATIHGPPARSPYPAGRGRLPAEPPPRQRRVRPKEARNGCEVEGGAPARKFGPERSRARRPRPRRGRRWSRCCCGIRVDGSAFRPPPRRGAARRRRPEGFSSSRPVSTPHTRRHVARDGARCRRISAEPSTPPRRPVLDARRVQVSPERPVGALDPDRARSGRWEKPRARVSRPAMRAFHVTTRPRPRTRGAPPSKEKPSGSVTSCRPEANVRGPRQAGGALGPREGIRSSVRRAKSGANSAARERLSSSRQRSPVTSPVAEVAVEAEPRAPHTTPLRARSKPATVSVWVTRRIEGGAPPDPHLVRTCTPACRPACLGVEGERVRARSPRDQAVRRPRGSLAAGHSAAPFGGARWATASATGRRSGRRASRWPCRPAKEEGELGDEGVPAARPPGGKRGRWRMPLRVG